MTLRRQMILRIALPTLIIYVVILGVATWFAYRESKQAVERSMTQLALSYAARFDGQLREAAQIAATTSSWLETAQAVPEETVYRHLEHAVQQSPLVYGACTAFEPGTVKPASVLFAPYVCRTESGLRRVNIDRSVYDWYGDPKYTWYSRPKSLGRAVWSDPYFDEGAGNILMATYSAPFRRGEGFGGVSTVDIDLPRLHRTVNATFDDDLDFVILTQGGQFVYDRDPGRIMAKTIFDIATETGRPALAALGRQMLGGGTGVASIDGWDSPERQWVFYAPIRSADWVFASRFPESRVLADVRRRAAWNAAALGLTLLLIVGCVVIVSRRIAAPIAALTDKVMDVAGGNLDVRIAESGSTDEIRQLAGSFNRMTGELRSHVNRLAAEQAAREAVERELDLAREIQRSLLPKTPPIVPGFEVAGWSLAAGKTGGDYFGWIELPGGRVIVTVADAAGHGLGPALLITVYRAYLHAAASAFESLYLAMNQINDLMVPDLANGRFITAVIAAVDPRERTVLLYSAGHGPNIFYDARQQRTLSLAADDVPLGVNTPLSDTEIRSFSCAAGDMLLLVTDGFFEWSNPDGKQYGMTRLEQFVAEHHALEPREFIEAMHADVLAFAQGTPQADDLTAVVLKCAADPG
ncbi:MAG: SpoIIE family protein phosphatase [Tepidisphaeraceae bacterium]